MEKLTKNKAIQLNPLSLAFVGDAEWSLYVRMRLTSEFDYKSGILSKLTRDFVNAAAQSKMLTFLEPYFSEDEQDIARRARNTHSISKAKNASLSDYRRATALEAVFGFLNLTGQYERLKELEKKCFELVTV